MDLVVAKYFMYPEVLISKLPREIGIPLLLTMAVRITTPILFIVPMEVTKKLIHITHQTILQVLVGVVVRPIRMHLKLIAVWELLD